MLLTNFNSIFQASPQPPGLSGCMAILCGREDGCFLRQSLTGCSRPLQNLYESIKNEPFKIPEDDGNDLTHTFFNPDREGWLLKLGEPGRVEPGPHPSAHSSTSQGLLVLLLLWSHSPQLQGRKIKKKMQ